MTTRADVALLGRLVVAAYRPKAGRDAELLELTLAHHDVLFAQNLVTARLPFVGRAGDGTIVEIFEWASPDAIDDAHTNPAVLDLWERFADVCDYVTLGDLPESEMPFAEFASVA